MTHRLALPIFLLLLSCTSPDTPECPVDLDLMAPLMTELHLAEALGREIPVQVRDSMQQVYFDKVLYDYRLTKPQFDSLMDIVRQEPVWIDSLYTRVGEDLARMEAARQ